VTTVGETARYVYAVTRGVDSDALAGLGGLRGAPVSIVRHRDLEAVVTDVPLEEFDEEALKRNLEQLPWLESVARGHHAVVDAVAARAPTAPMRLATIFLDDDAVRRRLDELYDEFVVALARIEGRREWSIKIIAPALEPDSGHAPAPPTSGAEFLRQKKVRAGEREHRRAAQARTAEDVHQALSRVAVASRLLAPQDPQLTGYDGEMVLNGAYLVPGEDEGAFTGRLDELMQRHPDTQFACGGPWPPYSFATLEEA
jgi:hypothetical protein